MRGTRSSVLSSVCKVCKTEAMCLKCVCKSHLTVLYCFQEFQGKFDQDQCSQKIKIVEECNQLVEQQKGTECNSTPIALEVAH